MNLEERTSTQDEHPRREIHFNLTTAQSNGKVSEANYDSPDEGQEKDYIQSKKVLKIRGESAKLPQQSPLKRNNYLLAVDNSDAKHKKLPPNGLVKGQRLVKEFPVSATTFFKTSTPVDKGFKFESSTSKKSKSQKKLGLTLQRPYSIGGTRSQSEKNLNKHKSLQRDPQDVAHNLHILKVQYNSIVEENTRLKTRNRNLEAVINTLYDDLNSQQQEIQKLYQGKQITPAALLTGSQVGLKRQLREERLINKNLTEELETVKKSLKATISSEQAVQIQFYQEECVRLRSMLELEIRQNKQTALNMIEDNVNVLTATTEEERKRILTELERQNEELKFVHKQNQQLRIELDQARLKRHEALKLKQMSDLQNRQAFLIKAKSHQIRTMEEQIKILNSKVENYDRLTQRNIDLSKQITDLNHRLNLRYKEIQSLKENSPNFAKSQTMKLPNLSSSPGQKQQSPVPALAHKYEKPNQNEGQKQVQKNSKEKKSDERTNLLQPPVKPFGRQMSVPIEHKQKAQQVRPKDDFEQNSNKPSFHMDTSPMQNLSSRPQSDSTHVFKKIVLSKQELVIRGLQNFKALAEKKEQPNNDIDQAFYKTYSKEIQQLYRKMQHQTLPLEVIKKLLDNRVVIPQGLDLQETTRICAEKFSVSASEVQVCEIILNHYIPCIQDNVFDVKKFYSRLEVLVNTHSENSMQSQELEDSIQEEEFLESEQEQFKKADENPTEVKMFDSQEKPLNVQVLSFQDNKNKGVVVDKQIKTTNTATQKLSLQLDEVQDSSQNAVVQQKMFDSRSSEQYSEQNQEYSAGGSMSGNSGNMIDQIVNMNNSITEEQMLDTAEQILNTLAQKLIENGWTVHDVFGQPEEIVRIIPEYENQTNIKVLSASNFLGRVYQVGIQNLTQLQVACLMRVLGKPEFDDSVRYDELELLLENFGVSKEQASSVMPEENQDGIFLEEHKMANQLALDGSPQNCSGEASEEVVFIDDTKPVVGQYLNQQNDRANEGEETKQPSQQRQRANLGQKASNELIKGLPPQKNQQNRQRLKSASKNTGSISDSAHGNTPTFVNNSAGPGTSGKNTVKSHKLLNNSSADTDDKNKAVYEKSQEQKEQEPIKQSVTNQSYQTSDQKESRQLQSRQILAKETNERLTFFFKEILSKITIQELLVLVERGGYKQQIKSKTTFTETSVINLENLLSILEQYTKIRLRSDELKAFQECVWLTPKFSKIIAVKHLSTFLKEAQETKFFDPKKPEETSPFGRRDRLIQF